MLRDKAFSTSGPYVPSKPKMRKWPKLARCSASATLVNIREIVLSLYDCRREMLDQQQLVTLLLRVAVAASLASIPSRFTASVLTLMREERTLVQRKAGLELRSAIWGKRRDHGPQSQLSVGRPRARGQPRFRNGRRICHGAAGGRADFDPGSYQPRVDVDAAVRRSGRFGRDCYATSRPKKKMFGVSRRFSVWLRALSGSGRISSG